MRIGREGFARGADVADSHRDVSAQGGVFVVFLLGLVAVECVGAQPHTCADRGGLFRLHRRIRQIGDNRHGVAAGAQLAGDDAAELEKIIVLDCRQFADANHDQARGLEALGRQNIQHRAALALEPVGRSNAPSQIGPRSQRLAGRGAEFQRVVAEHDEDAARGGGKRDEADLDGVGHGQILQKSGCNRAGKTQSMFALAGLHVRQEHLPRQVLLHYGLPGCAKPSGPWPDGHIT